MRGEAAPVHLPAQRKSWRYRIGRFAQRTWRARCQEVRVLGVDAAIERLLLEALTPDRLALAIAALSDLETEAACSSGSVGGMSERSIHRPACGNTLAPGSLGENNEQ